MAFIGAYIAHFVPPLSLRNTDRLSKLHLPRESFFFHCTMPFCWRSRTILTSSSSATSSLWLDTDVIRTKGAG